MSRSDATRPPSWLATALACVALLVVPFGAWILIPAPAAPRLPTATAATAIHREVAESERPSRPARAAPTDEAPAPPVVEDRAPGPVSGRVLDSQNDPVPEATVTCTDRDPEVSASTDLAGRFELPPEASGCNAVARARGHTSSQHLVLAAQVENTLRLEPNGGIEGVVVDEYGAAVRAYMIAIESFAPAGGNESPSPVGRPRRIDDPAGAFEWQDLPAGRYVLTASAEGRPPTRSDRIEVEPGRTARQVRITLSRGASLSGTVVDAETNKPIAGASVGLDAATSTGANAIPGTTTDASGAFTFPGVPSDAPFSLRVAHPAYRTKIMTMTLRGGAGPERIALHARGDGGAESELAGIGAMLGQGPEGVVIQGVIEGGPAARAGLTSGDRLLFIDGADATKMTLSDCVQRLRGPEGTRVGVRVSRGGVATLDVTILRAIVVH